MSDFLTPNDWLRDIIAQATASGWIVTEAKVTTPCSITLQDPRGNEVVIRSKWGLDIPHYVQTFKAQQKQPLRIEKA